MVSRRVIRAVTPPTLRNLPPEWLSSSPASGSARFGCRFNLLLGILKAPYREDTLVHRRNSALRPCVGAVCDAGVGPADGCVFMPPGGSAIPLQYRRQTEGREPSPVSGFEAGSSHPCAPPAPNSREENQRPGERDSGAPMLHDDTSCRSGGNLRTANHGWAQPVPRTTLAALPPSHTFID
jgi:hypothetical protein